jgi:hypothetical protein
MFRFSWLCEVALYTLLVCALLHARAAMPRFDTAEDLNGYKRGAHQDGEDVCPGFVFHLPGSSSTAEHVVWGWNDTASFFCERCKRPATEHIVLKAPVIVETKPKPPAARLPPQQHQVFEIPTQERQARQAEQAAFFNAGYDPTGMLTEDNDPLAVNARPKPKPPPPPAKHELSWQLPPDKQAEMDRLAAEVKALRAREQPTGKDFVGAPEATPPADLAEVQDPALMELLVRDANANEAFKREVERMVREANRKQELDAHAKNSGAAQAQAPSASAVSEIKDLSGCTVPRGHFKDASAMLRSVGMEKYADVFEEEAMEPDTLIEVLQQQGRSALDEAIKELGIKSMGHRLKIINALIVQ